MTIRPYIHEIDFPRLSRWVEDERIHALWCAGLMPYALTEEGLLTKLWSEAETFGGRFFVAEESGRALGFYCYSYNEENRLGFFKFVVTDNDLRGRGYGKRMLSAAIDRAISENNAAGVQLNVFDVNHAAINCYKALGFALDEVSDNAFRFKDELWAKHHMLLMKNDVEIQAE